MTKTNKKMLALVLACALVTMLIGALPVSAGAAQTIDISTIDGGATIGGAAQLTSGGTSGVDSWTWSSFLKQLSLIDAGPYTLTGSNGDFNVKTVANGAQVILDNMSSSCVIGTSSFSSYYDCTLTLVGSNTITQVSNQPAVYLDNTVNLVIDGNGTLDILNHGFFINDNARLIIDGSASVAVTADNPFTLSGAANNTAIGDAASLTIVNDGVAKYVTVTAYPSTSSAMWKLTGSATTSDSLTAASIEVTVPGGTTGTIAREAIPVAPIITSPNKLSVVAGTGGSLPLTATGYPAPTWSLSGAPAGVGITGSTLTVASTVPAGTYTFSINATNGVEPDATQSFILTVTKAGGSNGGNGGGGKLPQTGDALSILAPVTLLIGSLATLSLTSDRRKRR